jgi:hypothetical protein
VHRPDEHGRIGGLPLRMCDGDGIFINVHEIITTIDHDLQRRPEEEIGENAVSERLAGDRAHLRNQ